MLHAQLSLITHLSSFPHIKLSKGQNMQEQNGKHITLWPEKCPNKSSAGQHQVSVSGHKFKEISAAHCDAVKPNLSNSLP